MTVLFKRSKISNFFYGTVNRLKLDSKKWKSYYVNVSSKTVYIEYILDISIESVNIRLIISKDHVPWIPITNTHGRHGG